MRKIRQMQVKTIWRFKNLKVNYYNRNWMKHRQSFYTILEKKIPEFSHTFFIRILKYTCININITLQSAVSRTKPIHTEKILLLLL